MQNKLTSLCLCLLAVGGGQASAQQVVNGSSPRYIEGVVRVKLQPELAAKVEKATLPTVGTNRAPAAYLTTGVAQLDGVASKVHAVSMRRVFPYAGKDEAKHRKYGLDQWYDITYDNSAMTPAQARNLYRSTAGIMHAQRIPVYTISDSQKYIEVSPATIAKAQKAASTMPFNDPMLSAQWHYHNEGQLSGTKPGADINVFPAWESGVTGSKDVVVAIVDGGFQVDHPDLKDNVWINEAELNGKPGVDDDGDGYVDDVYGYNFVVGSANISAHTHGTHVAGTVGATNGNGIGVCGVAGGSDGTGGVKMMVCQVFDSRASSSAVADYGAALVYAADRGASIAQCSWGMSTPDDEDEATAEGVRYFTKEGGGDKMDGGLCIFAAGNTADEGNYYPGCMSEVVAVGATTATGEPAYYASRGTWVDVSAPGGLKDNGDEYGVLSTLPGDSYGYEEGTSMACPHVSGVAALILSKYGNKNFSNETLRTMLTTSVNDIYGENSEYAGMFGSGCIDAYKALQGNESSVPGAVSDFTLTPSHDNVLVEWTIPDSEEKAIDHHVIYYSTEQFAATDDLTKLNRATVDTKYKYSGDAMSYELTGLKAQTTYYFAIVAYNRWGKASQVSPVKSATTNEGPLAKLDKTALAMTLDASKSDVTEGTFNILNNGKGVLKYELVAATTRATYSTSARNNTPKPGNVVAFSGKMTPASASTSTNKLVTSDYEASDWPSTLSYSNYLRAYLGESDEEKPNAFAQYFKVDKDSFPNGFNLTALNIKGSNGENPVIEIYDGSRSISTASLLQRVDYDYFAYGYDINLNEQIYFAPGESFWVVAKFPAGQKNPLGAAMANKDGISNYSYYSSDNGNSWTLLSEVLKGSTFESVSENLTWSVDAVSKNPDWSAVLNPAPKSGEIRPGEQQTVTLKNDGQKMINGTYKFNLRMKTNESEANNETLAVTMTVKNNKPEIVSQQLIDFGHLLVGQTKTLDIELTNKGYGKFGGRFGAGFYTYNKTLTCTSDQFDLSQGAPAVSARSSNVMHVTYSPTKAGSVSGTVTLTDANKNTYSFTVSGIASEPPLLSMDSSEFDLGDLKVGGDAKTATFTIKNDGKYPLQYVFPKFSDKNVEGTTEKAHKFGYSCETNLDDDSTLEYEPEPELADEVDITSQFGDNSWISGAVSLGFKFPFYGTNYDKVYITSHGGISMNTVSHGTIGCFVPQPTCMSGLGYISAYGNSGLPGSLLMRNGSKVSYGHKDGNFVVKFHECYSLGTDGEDVPLSFHIVLSPDGNATIYYDNYTPSIMRDEGQLMYVGVTDVDVNDPFTVTDADAARSGNNDIYNCITTGTVLRIVAPGQSIITGLSSTDGYIGIGESKEFTVTAKADDTMNAGNLTNNLVVLTNDPKAASHNIVFKANITGDNLKPEAAVDSTAIDFGKVFRTSVQKRVAHLANNGKDVLKVSAVSLAEGKFTVSDDVKSGFTVPAGQSKDITVVLPTENSGSVEDKLTVSYSDGTSTVLPLKGEVIGCPQYSATPSSDNISTPYGESVERSYNFANNGDEPLTVSVASGSWFKFKDLEADDVTSSVDYTWESSANGQDVDYEWEDILSDYDEHMAYSYFADQTDYKEVTLPFSFPFYGKKYDKMYIYNTGFVSFDKPEVDYKQFPEPPATIPTTETFYTNIICPFWGNHTMNTAASDGVYYKAYTDRVVVSFKDYGNTMMQGMNFEVVLNNDGTFKFQYKLDDEGFMSQPFGLCGIMDHSGKRGIQPSDNNISSGNAVLFRPGISYVIASGTSVDMPVEIDANRLANTYEEAFSIATNDPANSNVTLPVSVEITGEAVPVWPEAITLTQVYDPTYTPGEVEFEVANNGKRAFAINNISGKMIEFDMDTYTQDAQLQVWMSTDQSGDDGPGPLSLTSSNSNMGWVAYYPGSMNAISVGLEPVRFKLVYFNTYQATTASSTLTFDVDGMDSKVIPVNINITEAPAMTFDRDEIVINDASDSFASTETLNIGNNGKYPLHYDLRLSPSGIDEAVDDTYEGGDDPMPTSFARFAPRFSTLKTDSVMTSCSTTFAAKVMRAAMKRVSDSQQYQYDVPYGLECSNLLYYPVFNPVTSAVAAMMGTGEDELDQNFYAATRYVAPDEGFNLTHLYFVGTVGDLENVDIEASVVLGSKVNDRKRIIGHGKIHVDKEEPNASGYYYGEARVLEFDKPVYINPADTFYVVLKYPAGYKSSALLASKDGDTSANRYMAYLKSFGGWIDIEATYDEAYSYGAFGYFMTCIEKEKGEPWIKLLNTTTEGDVAVGETLPVKFAINAGSTYFAKDNKATLVIHSNDPEQKTVNYHIWLNKNAAPDITSSGSVVLVPQGKQTNVKLSVSDADGDAFTVKFTDKNGWLSIGECTNSNGTTDGISISDGVISVEANTVLNANVTLSPDYGEDNVGAKSFTIVATDANGNAAETDVDYSVEFTNRTPVFTGEEQMTVVRGETTPVTYYSNLFSDPDNDDMTFATSIANSAYAEIYEASDGFVVCGKRIGKTKITVVATDANGGSTSAVIDLNVTSTNGINGIEGNANDALLDTDYSEGKLNVKIGCDADVAELRVYTTAGQLMAQTLRHNVHSGDSVVMPLDNVTPGVYQLSATIDGKNTVVKFVVK